MDDRKIKAMLEKADPKNNPSANERNTALRMAER